MNTTIYLIRHGQTEENARNILQGHMQGHLSAEGTRQAETLALKLAGTTFDALTCSDLKRCTDTANILNSHHHLPMHITPLLRERDWGSFTGRLISEVQGIPFPPDVESVEEMLVRARRVLAELQHQYHGQRLLVVSHGLFCRALQAVYFNKAISDIKRMENAECRILELI